MEPRKGKKMLRRDFIVVAMIVTILAALAMIGIAGAASGPKGPRDGFAGQRSEGRLAVTYGPYLGIRCWKPNATGCDRVGIDVVLKKRATRVVASLAGRRISLRTPGLHNGARGRDWVGDLAPAGLGRNGSPLYLGSTKGRWEGDPPVFVPIRVTATRSDGRRHSVTFPRVQLRPGWG
jgi:hypothetical protein